MEDLYETIKTVAEGQRHESDLIMETDKNTDAVEITSLLGTERFDPQIENF